MAIAKFSFQTHWSMKGACKQRSSNPAPPTGPGIYIIHNSIENTTYVGYADDVNDRWKTRTEVFHIMGISEAYGEAILCAYCKPSISDGDGATMPLKGKHGFEHLLVRGVVNGLLGVTTSTNTQLGSINFVSAFKAGLTLRVYLPSDPWGQLYGRREATL